jgi:hypothetical protein
MFPLVVRLLGPNLRMMNGGSSSSSPTSHQADDECWHRHLIGSSRISGYNAIQRMTTRVGYYLSDVASPETG